MEPRTASVLDPWSDRESASEHRSRKNCTQQGCPDESLLGSIYRVCSLAALPYVLLKLGCLVHTSQSVPPLPLFSFSSFPLLLSCSDSSLLLDH